MGQRARYKRYPAGVRENAMERMRLGVNVSELAEQLGVHRSTLYFWREQYERRAAKPEATEQTTRSPAEVSNGLDERDYRIRDLEGKLAGLEVELGRAELEKSFFEGALRRVKESRRKRGDNGETGSSTKSATGRTRKAD